MVCRRHALKHRQCIATASETTLSSSAALHRGLVATSKVLIRKALPVALPQYFPGRNWFFPINLILRDAHCLSELALRSPLTVSVAAQVTPCSEKRRVPGALTPSHRRYHLKRRHHENPVTDILYINLHTWMRNVCFNKECWTFCYDTTKEFTS